MKSQKKADKMPASQQQNLQNNQQQQEIRVREDILRIAEEVMRDFQKDLDYLKDK